MNKYNLGDKLWTIYGSNVEEVKITGIFLQNEKVRYSFNQDGTAYLTFLEDKFFKTKQELIESL